MSDLFLSLEEELELGRRVQVMVKLKSELGVREPSVRDREVLRVGERAVEELALAYVNLVHKIARSYSKKYGRVGDLEEIVADGMVGLTRAIYKYDPERGNKFSTVAVDWVRQAISRGFASNSRIVRVPENRVAVASAYYRFVREASLRGEVLSDRELEFAVAEELGVKPELVRDVVRVDSLVSLDKVLSEGFSLGDVLVSGVSVEQEVESRERYERLYEVFGSLSPFELKLVCSMMTGARDYPTLRDVANEFSLSYYSVQSALGELKVKLAEALKDLR